MSMPSDDVSEETEASWIQFLARFDRELWPMFKAHGFKKDTAIIMWTLNKIENGISDMKAILEDQRYD